VFLTKLVELFLVVGRCVDLLDEWVGGAKELLKDVKVISSVDITCKFVLTLLHTILQAEVSILIIDAFH